MDSRVREYLPKFGFEEHLCKCDQPFTWSFIPQSCWSTNKLPYCLVLSVHSTEILLFSSTNIISSSDINATLPWPVPEKNQLHTAAFRFKRTRLCVKPKNILNRQGSETPDINPRHYSFIDISPLLSAMYVDVIVYQKLAYNNFHFRTTSMRQYAELGLVIIEKTRSTNVLKIALIKIQASTLYISHGCMFLRKRLVLSMWNVYYFLKKRAEVPKSID